jgi:hypothetical protein
MRLDACLSDEDLMRRVQADEIRLLHVEGG